MARRGGAQRHLRAAPTRDVEKRVLIVCEGEVTEVEYLRALITWARQPTIDVVVVGLAVDPLTLVDEAIARRGADADAWDDVWCCFDVDDFGLRVGRAREKAKAHGVKMAMSNPCFELWLYLHHHDSPGMRTTAEMQRLFSMSTTGVDAKHVDFDALQAGYGAAVRRAKKLYEDAIAVDEPMRNPLTEVYRLTESIVAAGRDGLGIVQQARQRRTDEDRARAEAAAARAMQQARDEGFDEGDQ